MSRTVYFVGWFLLLFVSLFWSYTHEWEPPVGFCSLFIVWMMLYLAWPRHNQKK